MNKRLEAIGLAAASMAGGTVADLTLSIPLGAEANSTTSHATTATTAPAPSNGWNATRPPVPPEVTKALDGLVAKNVITQAQADAVAKALTDAFPRGGPGDGHHGGPGVWHHGGHRAHLEPAAKAIGTTEQALLKELQSGKTIAEVAKAHGVDVQKVIDAMVVDAKAHIAAEVKAGRLTQAEANRILSELTKHITDMVNNKMPDFPGGHRGFGGRHPGIPGG